MCKSIGAGAAATCILYYVHQSKLTVLSLYIQPGARRKKKDEGKDKAPFASPQKKINLCLQ